MRVLSRLFVTALLCIIASYGLASEFDVYIKLKEPAKMDAALMIPGGKIPTKKTFDNMVKDGKTLLAQRITIVENQLLDQTIDIEKLSFHIECQFGKEVDGSLLVKANINVSQPVKGIPGKPGKSTHSSVTSISCPIGKEIVLFGAASTQKSMGMTIKIVKKEQKGKAKVIGQPTDAMESQLYLEIIETEKGKHRFGIAYPGADKEKLETAEVDLPPDGVAHPITLDGHKITVYCRYTKKPNKRMKTDQ